MIDYEIKKQMYDKATDGLPYAELVFFDTHLLTQMMHILSQTFMQTAIMETNLALEQRRLQISLAVEEAEERTK